MSNKIDLSGLEKIVGYSFKDTDILLTAMSHRSYLNESERNESNERLEYLGDAVLELLISDFLFRKYKNEAEGVLTAARSVIVKTESLAEVAKKLHLGEYLLMSRGEEQGGGRDNVSLLADTTEALIGAVYLDGGYEEVKKVVEKHVIGMADELLAHGLKDAKSMLQERVQEKGFGAPVYETVKEEGPDHDKRFVVEVKIMGKQAFASGEGKNKQAAQQAAAAAALDQLENEN